MRIDDRRLVARDDDVVELTLVDPDGATLSAWHPGAHIDVYLPSGRTRQYSFCGDPDREREYRIAVRRIPDGGGCSIEVHELAVGQIVEISEPRNAFMMPLPGSGSKAEKLRFMAGGIGITPILPMVRLAERLGVPWSLCLRRQAPGQPAVRGRTGRASETRCGYVPTTSTVRRPPPSSSTAWTGAPPCMCVARLRWSRWYVGVLPPVRAPRSTSNCSPRCRPSTDRRSSGTGPRR